MKKNAGMLILFLLLGWFIGTWVATLLEPVAMVSFLTRSTTIDWEPSANLDMIRYHLEIHFKVSLLSLIGIVASIWAYRKL
ncbi:DUF4321 domain-containing protein [Paenibacillus sp. PsM32]|uniref:DUF4321 domain-containing protein n=1 Tax=Paenibacillus kyungheensis TaxID=1452732 RepID=A0AAX3LYJ1_9BACL|nr:MULTISPECIES: DUF4321 domain-containing protein [Paenibacillus]MDN4619728.1 DUF4321 domain-containing protein [Paenibacillus sp. PsM32]MDQ1235371.1 hypothetical protein [Paenibacillus sp. SORGH_AS_0306]MDR6112419.1 hypothetical protein [Paenibacillus sp. SORGH_AS_0338]WCT54912.1 DUF4321 domain-containing protein [Paenibacillus kyungheensis]WDF51946.1 DUF4321 domain-containing protein [Paenibacillus sp. KACC 21273]